MAMASARPFHWVFEPPSGTGVVSNDTKTEETILTLPSPLSLLGTTFPPLKQHLDISISSRGSELI